MRRIIAALTSMVVVACPLSVNASTTYTCAGMVGDLALNPSGLVYVSVGDWAQDVHICQIGTTYNNVSSDVCKAIYTHLLTAKTTGTQVYFSFDDGGTCASHAAWQDLTGWYFGPDMQ